MPRPKALRLPEEWRESRSCHSLLELTLDNFALHLTCRNGFNTTCR